MGRWRTKLLFSLIVYSAGFVTAVYVLAPTSATAVDGSGTGGRYMWSHQGTEEAGLSSQDRAAAIRAEMDKAVRFAEDNAVKGYHAIKSRIDQWRQEHGQ